MYPSKDLFVVINASDIKVLHVPFYKGLTIEEILEVGKKKPELMNYLPEERDMHRLPRYFIVNVVYTIVGQPIKDFVS